MAFADWNQNLSSNASVVLDIITPIIGISSLNFRTTSASSNLGGYLTPTVASGLTKGIEQGRLRTLMSNDNTSGNGMGLLVIGSADTLATVAGSYYRLDIFNTGASATYALNRSNTSAVCLSTNPGTSLIAATTLAVTSGTTYGVQLEFIVDVADLGGVYLKFSRGTATDFSDLSTIAQFLDSGASILTASSSEGVYSRTSGVQTLDIRMDQTSLYQLV